MTPPEPLAFWNAPADWHTPEGAVFPGVTAVLLVAIGIGIAWREGSSPPAPLAPPLGRARPRPRGARHRDDSRPVGSRRGSAGAVPPVGESAYKPLSIATLLFLGWALTSAPIRDARKAYSTLAFYSVATLAMAVLALGPTARLMGERVLYKAPYAWLMLLPGFADGFRAPARFAMLVALCLSVAAALAFVRLTRRTTSGARALIAGVVVAGVLIDSWVYPFVLEVPPAPLVVPTEVPADAAVLELPSGVFEDAAAMYRATMHGRPTVNGLSGYAPPHYGALQSAIRDEDTGALELVAVNRPLAVFVRKQQASAQFLSLLPRQSRARHLASTPTHEVFLLTAGGRAPAPMPDSSRVVPIAGIHASVRSEQVDRLQDGNRRTAWISDGPQRGAEALTIRLPDRQLVSGVFLAHGPFSPGFPRQLTIEVAEEQGAWRPVWHGPTGARTVAAAFDDPRDVRVYHRVSAGGGAVPAADADRAFCGGRVGHCRAQRDRTRAEAEAH